MITTDALGITLDRSLPKKTHGGDSRSNHKRLSDRTRSTPNLRQTFQVCYTPYSRVASASRQKHNWGLGRYTKASQLCCGFRSRHEIKLLTQPKYASRQSPRYTHQVARVETSSIGCLTLPSAALRCPPLPSSLAEYCCVCHLPLRIQEGIYTRYCGGSTESSLVQETALDWRKPLALRNLQATSVQQPAAV